MSYKVGKEHDHGRKGRSRYLGIHFASSLKHITGHRRKLLTVVKNVRFSFQEKPCMLCIAMLNASHPIMCITSAMQCQCNAMQYRVQCYATSQCFPIPSAHGSCIALCETPRYASPNKKKIPVISNHKQPHHNCHTRRQRHADTTSHTRIRIVRLRQQG